MEIKVAEIVNWIIVGMIAGGFVGMLLTGKREGYGWFKNLGMGLAGGLIGGFLFIKLIKLDFGMSDVKITLQDLVAAILGTLIVFLLVKVIGKKGKQKPAS
jgi:uncharacterized membrane protein YeaQ/YmgE (transglycosylase-associated protein family)